MNDQNTLAIPSWMITRQMQTALISHLKDIHADLKSTSEQIEIPIFSHFQKIEESQKRMEEIESLSRTSYWEWDSQTRKFYLSPHACHMIGKQTGWNPGLLEFMKLLGKSDRVKIVKAFRRAVEDNKSEITYECETTINNRPMDITLRGRITYSESGFHIYAVAQDVTMVKDYERLLRELIFVDSLTGLANRSLFREESLQKLLMGNLLREAISRNEIYLCFQPQINLESGNWTGAEALIRWNSPELGPVSPVDFIPLAEENGMILHIGRWVFKETCEAAVKWNKYHSHPMKIAVNLSPKQFHEDQDLLNFIEQTLEQTGCNPKWIELEITEGIFIQDFKKTNAILRSLNKMGFTLSLDDFGTGYSSLGQIRQIPVNGIKIDRSFLQDVPDCQAANDYVRVIISIAKTLHLEMIAEGVETKEQADFLIREGCPTVQGYYFGTPITIDQFEEKLPGNRFTQFPMPALRSLQGKSLAHSFCPHRETDTCSVLKESAKCLFHGKGNLLTEDLLIN